MVLCSLEFLRYLSESDILEQHFCDECLEKKNSGQGNSSQGDAVAQSQEDVDDEGDVSDDARKGVDRWLVYSSQSGLFTTQYTSVKYKCEEFEKRLDGYEWRQGKRVIDVDLAVAGEKCQALLFQVEKESRM